MALLRLISNVAFKDDIRRPGCSILGCKRWHFVQTLQILALIEAVDCLENPVASLDFGLDLKQVRLYWIPCLLFMVFVHTFMGP